MPWERVLRETPSPYPGAVAWSHENLIAVGQERSVCILVRPPLVVAFLPPLRFSDPPSPWIPHPPPETLTERPFRPRQTTQNPADIDGPAGCVSLVDDARAKPANANDEDADDHGDDGDGGVPFPELTRPRRSTSLLSTRVVIHPNHRPEVVARDLAWSPLGLAPPAVSPSGILGGGCLLAIASSAHRVTVHAPPRAESDAEWAKVCDVSEMFASVAEAEGWLEDGGDAFDPSAFETAPPRLQSPQYARLLLRAREAPLALPAVANGVGGRGEKRTALPAAGVGEGASGGGGGGGWPTEAAKFPADSLRVGAAVEVRRRPSSGADSSGADSGAAGGWRPGTVQSLVSAFNFRVRVCFDEPVRGAPRCVWLVCENDGEFPALRLDGEGASAAGCHEFPSQSLGFEGASGVFELRPAQSGWKDGVVGEAEVAMTRRGGWVPAIVVNEKGGALIKLGVRGEGQRSNVSPGTIRSRPRMAWIGEGCAHGAWRKATDSDYSGYKSSDFTFLEDEEDDEEDENEEGEEDKEGEEDPVAPKPEPTVAKVTIPKETDVIEKEELPDAAPVAVADRPTAATAGKTRGRKPTEHFTAAYANELRASAKAAAAKAAAGCGAKMMDAPGKAVEAVFTAAKVGDDVFAAVNDVSKANKSRRNAGLKDIALRVCDAFLAARAGAGITRLYPQGKHLDKNDDRPLLEKVEKLVWEKVAPRVQKNKDKVRKELKPPTQNGYQLEIRENVIQADDNDEEEDVSIARRARAARAISILPADEDEDEEDDEDDPDASNASSSDDDEEDDDEPKPKRQRGRRASITAASSADPASAAAAARRAAAAAALSVAWSPRLDRAPEEPPASVLAVGCKSGAVTLWLVRRPATAGDGGAVDVEAMGRFRACDGCATSLAWTGDVRLGESQSPGGESPGGESPGGESPGGGFALVVGGSDGSVRTFTASRKSLLAAAGAEGGRRGRRATRAVPLEPGAELSPADGDPVTRVAVADSVKIDSDNRAHARPVIAAGKASGTVAAWRLGAHDSTSAEATWSARCHVQPVSGLAWCAAPEIANCAAVRLVSMHTTGAAVAYTVPTDPRARHDDWTLTDACVEDLTVASIDGLDLNGNTAGGGAKLPVSSHAGLASSPAGVLVATAAGFVASTYASGATMIQSRARRGRVAVAPPAALAAGRVKSHSMTEISGDAASGKLDDGAADESLSVAFAARRLPFLASDRGVSLWDVRAAAKHAGADGARELESAAGEMQSTGGARASQLAKSLLSGAPEKFVGFEPLSCEGCGRGYPRGEGWPGCGDCGLLLRPEDVTRAALSRAMI